MNQPFVADYAENIISEFEGTYGDYYIRCCDELFDDEAFGKHLVLFAFSLYNV